MIKRVAVVSLAVAGLSGPASAMSSLESGEPSLDTTQSGVATSKAKPVRLAARAVAVTPPERPVGTGIGEIASSGLSGAREVIVLASLPPAPSSEAGASALSGITVIDAAPEAPVVVSVPDIGGKRVVSVLPPLRPSLPGMAATDMSAEPDPVAEAPEAVPVRSVVAVLPPSRPAFADPVETASLPDVPAALPAAEAAPVAPTNILGSLFAPFPSRPQPSPEAPTYVATGRPALDAMIARHASLNSVPVDLVHRVVVRESKYNPRAVGRGGAMGLMQIKTGTARGLGYNGDANGLLDAETNLTYAVKYLAGAFRTAGGDYSRAISYYARGYYYAAKRGLTQAAAIGPGRRLRQEADASTTQ